MQSLVATYVKDSPGMLNRLTSLFHRRRFRIQSLAFGKSERKGILRLTIVAEQQRGRNSLVAHLYKNHDVLGVEDLTKAASVIREVALIKVPVGHASSAQFKRLTREHCAKVLEFTPDSVIVEICQKPHAIDEVIAALGPLGVIELARSGQVAIGTQSPAAPTTAVGSSADIENGNARITEQRKITKEQSGNQLVVAAEEMEHDENIQ